MLKYKFFCFDEKTNMFCDEIRKSNYVLCYTSAYVIYEWYLEASSLAVTSTFHVQADFGRWVLSYQAFVTVSLALLDFDIWAPDSPHCLDC